MVALHGFTGSGEDFCALAPGLDRAFLAPDLPGHGRAEAPADERAYRMERAVGGLAELLDRDIHVQTLKGRVDTKGLGKMVVGLLAAAVEIERDLLLERIAEGLKRAVGSAMKLNRKRTWDEGQTSMVVEMRNQEMVYGTISTKMCITASKVRRILNATAVDAT